MRIREVYKVTASVIYSRDRYIQVNLTVYIRDDFWELVQWPLYKGWPLYTGPLYAGSTVSALQDFMLANKYLRIMLSLRLVRQWTSLRRSLKPIDACAARNRPWRTLAFLPLLTSSLLTKIGISYIQLLQEEKIFPMMPRSGLSAQWSLRYAQICSKSWVKNSEQNVLPLHLAAPC